MITWEAGLRGVMIMYGMTPIYLEKYLILVKNTKRRIALSRLRLSNHNLMIEKGRHLRPQVERNEKALNNKMPSICSRMYCTISSLLPKFYSFRLPHYRRTTIQFYLDEWKQVSYYEIGKISIWLFQDKGWGYCQDLDAFILLVSLVFLCFVNVLHILWHV